MKLDAAGNCTACKRTREQQIECTDSTCMLQVDLREAAARSRLAPATYTSAVENLRLFVERRPSYPDDEVMMHADHLDMIRMGHLRELVRLLSAVAVGLPKMGAIWEGCTITFENEADAGKVMDAIHEAWEPRVSPLAIEHDADTHPFIQRDAEGGIVGISNAAPRQPVAVPSVDSSGTVTPSTETPATAGAAPHTRSTVATGEVDARTVAIRCAEICETIRGNGPKTERSYGANTCADFIRAYADTLPRSATAIRYLVRSGGECPQDWLCQDIPEVQAALCEALYGRAEDADPDEIGKYLAAVQTMPPEELRREWRFEDGWIEVIKIRCTDSRIRKSDA